MNPSLRLALASALLALAAAPAEAATVALRAAPQPEAPVLRVVDESDALLREASPVADREKAEAGWKEALWSGPRWEGYVPSAALSKNFELELGTALRAEPSHEAPALGVVEGGDRFEIVESGEAWTRLRSAKPRRVFFQEAAELSDSPAVLAPAPSASARRSGPSATFDPRAGVGSVRPGNLPPENVIWSAAPADRAPAPAARTDTGSPIPLGSARRESGLQPIDIVVPPVQTQARETPIRPQAEAGTPSRRLAGTLVREISNFGPPYPLRLKSAGGRRIAYVDMSGLFIPTLRPYLDREVVIEGRIRPIASGSDELVILARSIRALD